MSWSISAEVTREDAVGQIQTLEPAYDIGEGARYQLIKAKEYACDVIAGRVAQGEKFTVTLAGHSQSDNAASGTDSISISIYAHARKPS